MRFIYSILNKINQKRYIGQTYDTKMRFKSHLHSRFKHNTPLYRAMRKYGIENFEFSVLEECADELSDQREIFWIKEFNSFKNGYNQTTGGETGKRLSDETKQILRDYNLGKRHLEITKKKISEKLKGIKKKPVSNETKLKQSNKAKGKVLSDKTKLLIREHARNKQSVVKFNLITNEIICLYDSIRSAAKSENLSYSVLRRRIITKKIIDNIIWKFYHNS